jgi:hypothetical protein
MAATFPCCSREATRWLLTHPDFRLTKPLASPFESPRRPNCRRHWPSPAPWFWWTSLRKSVQTTSAATGHVINEQQARELTLPTRNFQQILTLPPGTVASLTNNSEMGRGDVNIHGRQPLHQQLVS